MKEKFIAIKKEDASPFFLKKTSDELHTFILLGERRQTNKKHTFV